MTRTQFLDARRNVRKEIIAYLSIVIIGLLATLAYLGITFSSATLKKDALSFFNTYGLWDLEVASTLLMDDADLEAIRALPSVAEAERVWQIDAVYRDRDRDTNVTVVNLPGQISRPRLLEGRLPETTSECAVEKELMDRCALSLGQRISLGCKPVSGLDPLLEKSFVITGVFQTPDHISFMVPVTPYIFISEECFNLEGLDGAFMKTRIRVAGAPENRYSDAYWDTVTPVQEALEALGEERAPLRRAQLQSSLLSKLEEGQAQLDEAAEKLREGRSKLDEGWAELAEAADQLAEGKDKLDRGGKQLNEASLQLKYAAEELRRGKLLLDNVELLLGRGVDWILAHVTESSWPPETGVSYQEFVQMLGQGKASVMSWIYNKSGYTSGLLLFQQADALFSSSSLNWYYLGEEYMDALTLYNKGKKTLEEGEAEYAEGLAAYEDGLRKLEDARAKIDEIDEGRWVVLNDRGNGGYMYAQANSEKLSSMSMSFSTIFLVVGALVIYATIGRMVEQQRKLVGAGKAMGLFNREVFAKYLYFACTASLLGVGFGILLAWLPLQRAILQTYERLMTYGEGTRSFLPLQAGIVVAGALAISVLAVYLGCSQLLRQQAIQLMQGPTLSGGRKKSGRSARKNLFYRLIFRNMRTDWSRVMVTIVSIAGGCLLMVVGFTLYYGISGVPDRQFGGIQTYEAEIFYDLDENPNAASEIEDCLDRNELPHISVYKASGVFQADGKLDTLTLIVAQKGEMEGYFALRSLNEKVLDLSDSGALVPRRFQEYYGVRPGEKVGVYDSGMNLRQLRVAGVFENYYGQLFFLTPKSYEEAFLSVPESNCFFVRTNGMPLDALQKQLAEIGGIVKVNDASAERETIEKFTGSLNFVVWIMLFIAGLMACFIVANFTITYIQRKTTELTTMRINGFSVSECIYYVAVDLVVTTIIGTLLGLVIGGYLGSVILKTTETPYIQMIRRPTVQSFLYSGLITFGFSLLTNSLALRRIKKLRLSDIS